jgi:Tol biopolymer transport system component
VSPDGRYVAFAVPAATGVNEVRVVRFTGGERLPFTIELPGTERPNGRNRWMPDGRSIAFNWNQSAQSGIFAQDFVPDSDTAASRRPLVLIEPGGFAETFAISPDGHRLTLATSHRSFGLLSAENVPGIDPPQRRR